MDESKDNAVEQAGMPAMPATDAGQVARLQGELEQARRENELILRMAQRGVVDIEAAALLISKRSTGGEGEDVDAALERMRRERPWLFGRDGDGFPLGLASPTAAVRRDRDGGRVELDRAAEQARQTGQRRDLIAYLRLRRQKSGR